MKVTLSQPTHISEGTLLFSIIDGSHAEKRLPLRQQLKTVQPGDTVVIQYESGRCDSKGMQALASRIKAIGAQPVLLCQTGNGGEVMRSATWQMGLPTINLSTLSRNAEEEIRNFRF